jgi:hypothetical protein
VLARAIARPVAGRVVENGEEPGTKVRARLELVGGAERLQIGFLDQILGVGGPVRQAPRGAIEAVEGRQGVGLEGGRHDHVNPVTPLIIPRLRGHSGPLRRGKPVRACIAEPRSGGGVSPGGVTARVN